MLLNSLEEREKEIRKELEEKKAQQPKQKTDKNW
jgi:hypothetical protein